MQSRAPPGLRTTGPLIPRYTIKQRALVLFLMPSLISINPVVRSTGFLRIFHFKIPYFSRLKFPNLSVDFQTIFNINGSWSIIFSFIFGCIYSSVICKYFYFLLYILLFFSLIFSK